MTTRPRFAEDANYTNGIAAVLLFAVFAVVFVAASFGDPAGFPEGISVTASLGYALFNIGAGAAGQTLVESEGFLAVFEIVDVVLVAALVASIMLARTETGGQIVSALAVGGGEADGAAPNGGAVADEDEASDAGGDA